jgi:hypothetical protein
MMPQGIRDISFTDQELNTYLNRRWRLNHLYKIKTEEKSLEVFKFNEIQEELYRQCEAQNHQNIKIIIDKYRKGGVSTFWLIYYLDDTLWNPYTTTAILAHRRDDVQKLFRIVKTAYATCPPRLATKSGYVWVKPKAFYDNKNELTFNSIRSSIYVGLENRGDTINNLHISEAAYIQNAEETLTATLGAVPKSGKANISIESTANGIGDWFQETYAEAEAGQGAYMAFFFGWWQKETNVMDVPDNYEPSQEVLQKAEAVKVMYGRKLTMKQMCWWDNVKKEQRKLMDQNFPTLASDSFLTSSYMVFDSDSVRKINTVPGKPYDVRIIGQLQKYETWRATIFVEPKPDREYVMGVDPSEGVGGDNSVIEIIDTLTLEQVAEFVSNKIPPAQLAKVVDNLGTKYNTAIAVVERNNHGHLVLDRLKDTYGSIYMMQVLDEKTQKKTRKLGFLTNMKTRDNILDEFEDLVSEFSVKINSAILKSEMLTFVTDETGKRIAKPGKTDDCIMAFSIGLKVARMPRTSFFITRLN